MELNISIQLDTEVRRSGSTFVARAPGLDLASQGDTEEKALENLGEAVQLFFESCIERGTLEAALKELGFAPTDRLPSARKDPSPTVTIPFMLEASRRAEAVSH